MTTIERIEGLVEDCCYGVLLGSWQHKKLLSAIRELVSERELLLETMRDIDAERENEPAAASRAKRAIEACNGKA